MNSKILALVIAIVAIAAVAMYAFPADITGMAFGSPTADPNHMYCLVDKNVGYGADGCCRVASGASSCATISDVGTTVSINGKPFDAKFNGPLQCQGGKTVYLNNAAYLYNFNQNASDYCLSQGYQLPA